MAAVSILKLSDLNGQIKQAIDGMFGGVSYWVIADVSNYSYKGDSNQHYFDLIEKEPSSSRIVAKISGRAWGMAAIHLLNFEQATGQKFKNDIHVLVNVTVQYHPAFGLQLNLLDIDTNFTLGQFEQQRNATLARLVNENPAFIARLADQYVTKNKQLSFNKVIQKIAVISSATSAGYQDFEHTLLNNPFKYIFSIDLYLSKVQGEENARPFLEKLIAVYHSSKIYDAVVILRGGGAQSDFLMFDNYELSRAVAKFPIPVITGIGHQKNETIVDLMAHTATKTPTKAAELIIAYNRNFEEELHYLQKRIIIKTQQMFALHTNALNHLRAVLLRDVLGLLNERRQELSSLSGVLKNRPVMLLQNHQRNLFNLLNYLKTFSKIFLAHEKTSLEHQESMIRAMSPQNILNKGFAILKIDGKIISDPEAIDIGKELTIQLAEAEINTFVQSKKHL